MRVRPERREGFALVAVLIVLVALLALLAPFLMGIERADRESGRSLERAAARLALDDAARHARAALDATHPALDDTPYWDSQEELAVKSDLDPGFVDAHDARGAMWDVEARDLSGLVDLASAGPGVLANLLGVSTWLTRAVAEDDAALPVASTRGFDDRGFLWVEGEWIAHGARAGGELSDLRRGAFLDADSPEGCSPGEPRAHGAGAPVLGLAALAVPEWRAGGSELRVPRDEGEVRELFAAHVAGALSPERAELLRAATTVHGDPGAGGRWQRGARVTSSVRGGVDCLLQVDEWRWMNPGTTVLVEDGRARELALVRRSFGGLVELARPLVHDRDAGAAVIRPLRRRPVNLNTAPPEVLRALFLGLKRVRVNSRITEREADLLVEAVVESRPLEGFRDFAERVVLPAAGLGALPDGAPRPALWDAVGPDGFLDREDAEALYRNGLNANDADLEFSTMPFCFASRGAFELSLRSAVNAQSGAERVALARDDVEVVVPQRELLAVWARQEDFDEALRLGREAPLWATGPEATGRHTAGATPPSRFAAHMGVAPEGPAGPAGAAAMAGRRVFASRDDAGWARLEPARTEAPEVAGGNGHLRGFEHFDAAPDGEGWALASAGPWAAATDDPLVRWASPADLLRPFSLSFWVKPERLSDGDFLFDLGGPFQDADRVSLARDGADLVLRVVDGAGDHPETGLLEETQVRLPLQRLPDATWTHLALDVRGTRPDQVLLLVDGGARARTSGLTRLQAPVAETDTLLRVESTEGFGAVGEVCTVAVGEELVEAVVRDGKTLEALHHSAGALAGRGGRMARERWLVPEGGAAALVSDGRDPRIPEAITNGADRSHPAGTPVQLYGYSMGLLTEVPTGEARLPGELGAFAVAVVTGFQGGDAGKGDAVRVRDRMGNERVAGIGLEGVSSKVTALDLARADDQMGGDASFMKAFDARGGYALVVQRRIALDGTTTTVKGTELGGAELVRYSGRRGTRLFLAGRGDAADRELLKTVGSPFPELRGARAFLRTFDGAVQQAAAWDATLSMEVFVLPVSLAAPSVQAKSQQFLDPAPGLSQYAQLTRTGPDTHLTEWVRYDVIAAPQGGMPSQLARADDLALRDAYLVLAGPSVAVSDLAPKTGPPGAGGGSSLPGGGGLDGGGGSGHSGGPGGGGALGGSGGKLGGALPVLRSAALATSAALTTAATPTPEPEPLPEPAALGPEPAPLLAVEALALSAAPAQQGSAVDVVGWQWHADLGRSELDAWPLARAVSEALRFRGVHGTHSHAHPAGTALLPVVRAFGSPSLFWGRFGAPATGDAAWLMDEDDQSPGWPVVVQRAVTPDEIYAVRNWAVSGLVATAGGVTSERFDPEFQGPLVDQQTLFALRERAPVLLVPTQAFAQQPNSAYDMRRVVRLAKFPTGELPRRADRLALGGSYSGGAGEPDGTLDELELGATEFGHVLAGAEIARGGSLVLLNEVDASAKRLQLDPQGVRTPQGLLGIGLPVLSELPPGGGLLRIGEEVLAYRSRDPQGGRIELCSDGRGLLGSEATAHARGEPVHFLSFLPATFLARAVGPADAALDLGSLTHLPAEGTLLLGEELVHHTRRSAAAGAGAVSMPRASSVPGARDEEGGGLFRGRFGTFAASHAADSAVIVFPFRYWDRWADRADAPELAYFGLEASQEDAFWRAAFLEEREVPHPGVHLEVLARADERVPWDAEPNARGARGGPWLFDGQGEEGEPLALGVQSDLLQLRVFARYQPGAFEPLDGLAHGWKCAPDLVRAGLVYVAPRTVLARVER